LGDVPAVDRDRVTGRGAITKLGNTPADLDAAGFDPRLDFTPLP